MTDKPVSPLRQRMIEDMTVRHFKEKVQKDYIRHVKNFKDFLGRSPDTATSEDLRLFQLHMTRNHVGAPSVNCAIVALRFFFKVTLERPALVRPLTFVHEPRKLPIVLSPSGERTSFSHALPAGGTTANFLRPSQKTKVARNIAAAGMPNASFGPYLSRRTGQKKIEIDEPALIAK